MKIKSLGIRALSGSIYVALIVVCLILGNVWPFLLATLLGVLATIELNKITNSPLNRASAPALMTDLIAVVSLIWSLYAIYPIAIFVAAVIVRFIMEIYRKGTDPIRDIARSCLSYIYIGMPLAAMLSIMWITHNSKSLLPIFFLIWINDTGAFLVGSTLGRHRLFERVSPKKSWEGFFGGLAFCIVASFLFGEYCTRWFGMDFGIGYWIALGVIVSVVATWGDLFESAMKRSLQIKDSGNIIPGHGGILDRIDSLLFVFPAVLLYLIVDQILL